MVYIYQYYIYEMCLKFLFGALTYIAIKDV